MKSFQLVKVTPEPPRASNRMIVPFEYRRTIHTWSIEMIIFSMNGRVLTIVTGLEELI
jgi:hypothetical protein